MYSIGLPAERSNSSWKPFGAGLPDCLLVGGLPIEGRVERQLVVRLGFTERRGVLKDNLRNSGCAEAVSFCGRIGIKGLSLIRGCSSKTNVENVILQDNAFSGLVGLNGFNGQW